MKQGWWVLIVVLAGCVSTRNVTVTNERMQAWQGKTIAVTTRPRADFVAMTAGKAAFAVVGAVAMIEAGKTIVKENDVQDPSPVLTQGLLSEAEQRFGVVPAANTIVAVDTTDIPKLAHAASGADLLLDVQSMGSQFRYFPTDWSQCSRKRRSISGWKAIAFLLPNVDFKRPYRLAPYVASIEVIEKATGIEFMPRMDAKTRRRLVAAKEDIRTS